MKRLSILFLIITFSQFSVNSQQNNIRTALLIIDIQNFYFPGDDGPGLVNPEAASLKAKEILEIFREKRELVVHVQHLARKKSDIEIHKNVKPILNEKVITKKEINSFLGTDLLEYLNAKSINRLVIIGMQTQLCVEGATRAAHDFGFECIVVEDACATRDLKFEDKLIKAEDVHYSVLATLKSGGYARIIDLENFKENIDKYVYQSIE